jgi:hypothetical protein
MAAKKANRVSKKVKALPARSLTAKGARGVKGGQASKEKWIEIQGWDWEVEALARAKKIKI